MLEQLRRLRGVRLGLKALPLEQGDEERYEAGRTCRRDLRIALENLCESTNKVKQWFSFFLLLQSLVAIFLGQMIVPETYAHPTPVTRELKTSPRTVSTSSVLRPAMWLMSSLVQSTPRG